MESWGFLAKRAVDICNPRIWREIQEDQEFKASLGYMKFCCNKTKHKAGKKKKRVEVLISCNIDEMAFL